MQLQTESCFYKLPLQKAASATAARADCMFLDKFEGFTEAAAIKKQQFG